MKVLVTGATGFIGAPLTAALAGAGYQVRAAVRDRRRRSLPADVEIVLLPDLAGAIDWTPLVAGMDAVVHLAGIAHVGPEIPDAIYDRVNHLATAALAGAAAKAGVRKFVFMSSTRAQAGAASNEPLTEVCRAAPDRRLRALQARRRSGRARIGAVRTRSCGRRWSMGPARRATWRACCGLRRCLFRCPSARSRTAARCSRSTT